MGNNKKKSKHNSNGRRAHYGSRPATALVRAGAAGNGRAASAARARQGESQTPQNSDLRTYSIPDYRAERSAFTVVQHIEKDADGHEHVRYEVSGDLDTPLPPIRDSRYLDQQQAIQIYRYMLLNRKMEVALENLYK